jgi:hypothetical protein
VSFLSDAAKYYKSEPHQKAAWDALEARIGKDTLECFKTAYRAAQKPPGANPLKVPYFSQNDNLSGTGYRECFSSSCAMLSAFYGKVKSDDQYNLIRKNFGDSTDLGAQLGALTKLGLKPSFRSDGDAADLERLIDSGTPVAVGWLHKGPVTSPTGGGHWSVVIGYTPTHFVFHDPNGEASLASGGYVSNNGGRAVGYSRKNWLPRWEVEGKGTGWYLTCSLS